jgi:hypothetical protein
MLHTEMHKKMYGLRIDQDCSRTLIEQFIGYYGLKNRFVNRECFLSTII